MDAKPFRPSRPLPITGDENLPPAKQIIHQRHKSTGTLLSQSAISGLQGAAKRAVFGDRSNTAKTILPYDEAAKMIKSQISNSTTVNDKENDASTYAPQKDAFLRPAQRPFSKGASILPSGTSGYVMPLVGGDSHLPSQALPKQSKRATTIIYNDSRSSVSVEPLCERNKGSSGLTYPIAAVPTAPTEPAVRQPRHHQSQPALNLTQQPLRAQLGSIPSQDTKSDNCTPWDIYPAQDDITEAPYLDAVEEIAREEQSPAQELSEGPLIPVPSLPEPVNAPMPKSTAKAVDFQPDLLPPLPAEDALDLSEYEDEDYYDDQGYTTAHSYRSRGDTTTSGITTIMFPPKLTKKGLAEVEAAREIVEANLPDEALDEEAWDISMVAEYGDDIFNYMRELEMTLLPNGHYMDIQTEIQWSMRSVLMDWVIQVHGRFSLLPETLFLTVNYIDRFLSYKVVSLGKLQLVGATAIFVAAKYEEINCPSVQEIVYMVDSGYSVDEILKAERFMLSMLNFELGWPGPMSFLRRISKADDYDLETRTLAKYFLEVTIMDERFVASPPSYLAAGAHCLSRLILDKGDWSPDHVYYSGYTYTQLKPLISLVLDCCHIARKHHAAVFEKYSDKRFKRCATYVEKMLAKGFVLPFKQALSYTTTFDTYDERLTELDSYAASNAALKMPIPTQG